MKTTLFILTLFPFIGYGQKQITWANFKGTPPADERNVLARTNTVMQLSTTENDGKFYFRVTGGMIESKSWTRTHSMASLKHERVHYLNAFIFAKMCQNDIDSMGLQGGGDSAKLEARKSFNYWYDRMSRAQDEFDLNSEHGNMKFMEEMWESLIDEQLQKLKK